MWFSVRCLATCIEAYKRGVLLVFFEVFEQNSLFELVWVVSDVLSILFVPTLNQP